MMSRIAVMAMIASALNETGEDCHLNQYVTYRGELKEMNVTKERDALMEMVADNNLYFRDVV